MASAGLVVSPNAIKSYGQVVAAQESTLNAINSALADVHLSADAFGKLPAAGDLYQAYMQHANEVLEITAKLPSQIAQVADGLYSCSALYSDLEQGMAGEIKEWGTTIGGSGGGSGGADASGPAFTSIVSETAGAYQWTKQSATTLPTAQAPANGQKGLSGLIDKGVNWVIDHVPELMKILDDVTGDTAALIAAANVWADQGNKLVNVIVNLREGALGLPDEWAGDASVSFAKFMANVTEGLTQLVSIMGQTEKILEEAAQEAATTHDTVVDIITFVVEWVVGNILVDVLTLGLATAAEAAADSVFITEKVKQAAQASETLAKVLGELQRILEEMANLKNEVNEAEGLGKLTKFLNISNKLASDTLKSGSILKLPSAIKGGKGIEAISTLAASKVIGKGALGAGIGVTGGAISAGTSAIKSPIKDLLTGNPQAAGHAIRQDGITIGEDTGLTSPSVPQAPPRNRIEALLNGTTPPPVPSHESNGPYPAPSPEATAHPASPSTQPANHGRPSPRPNPTITNQEG